MNYEEKIKELNDRIEKLEKAEARRVLKKKIKISFEVSKVVIIVIILVSGYFYINNKLIKPYKDKIDYVEEKVNYVEKFVKDKWNSIQKYNPFSN